MEAASRRATVSERQAASAEIPPSLPVALVQAGSRAETQSSLKDSRISRNVSPAVAVQQSLTKAIADLSFAEQSMWT